MADRDALVIDENVLNEKAHDFVAPGGVKGVRSFLEPGEERRRRFRKPQIGRFLALLAGERRKLGLRRPLPLAQFGHSAAQFVQRQKVLLIGCKQALDPFVDTDKFALQSLRTPSCRTALPRRFQTPVDLRLDERRIFQQLDDCQSARKRDPGSACKKDPRDHPFVRFSSAILPSRPMRLLSRRAQRRSRTAAFGGRPQGLFLRAVSTTA